MKQKTHYKLLGYFAVLFLLFTCTKPPIVSVDFDIQSNQDKFSHIRISFSRNGRPAAKIEADSALRTKEAYSGETVMEFFRHYEAKLYNNNGDLDAVVHASYCKINEHTRYMYMKGNVSIVTTKGDRINSKDLTWNNHTQEFTTNDSIDIQRPNERVKGVGFVSNSDFSKYKIFRPVGAAQTQTIDF